MARSTTTNSTGDLEVDEGVITDTDENWTDVDEDHAQAIHAVTTTESVADEDGDYTTKSNDGTVFGTYKAWLSNADPDGYLVGVGPASQTSTTTLLAYQRVMMVSSDYTWMLREWTLDGVVVEGVPMGVLLSSRTTGNRFVRIGLPKWQLRKVVTTLTANFQGIMRGVMEDNDYYWTNADLTDPSFESTFSYVNECGALDRTSFVGMMVVLNGRSSLCTASIAINVETMELPTATTNCGVHTLMVSLLGAVHLAGTDVRSPRRAVSATVSPSL